MAYAPPPQPQTRRDQDLYLSLRTYALTAPTLLIGCLGCCRSRYAARDRYVGRRPPAHRGYPTIAPTTSSHPSTPPAGHPEPSSPGFTPTPLHSISERGTGRPDDSSKRRTDSRPNPLLAVAHHSTRAREPHPGSTTLHPTARWRPRSNGSVSATLLLLLSIAILQFDYTEGCSRRAKVKAKAPLGFNITEALQNAYYSPTPHTNQGQDTPAQHSPRGGIAKNETSPPNFPLNTTIVGILLDPKPNNKHPLKCNESNDCAANAYCAEGICQCRAQYAGPSCSYSFPGKAVVSVGKAGVTSGIVVAILFAFTVIFILYLFLQNRKRSLHLKSALAVREIAALKASYDLHGEESSTFSDNPYAINAQQVTMGSVPDIFRAKFYDTDPDHRVASNKRRPSAALKGLEPFKATFEELLSSIALVSYKSGSIFKSRVSIALRGGNRSRSSLVPGNRDRRKSSHVVGPRDDDKSLIPLDASATPHDDDRETTFLPNLPRPKPNFE